MLKRLWRWLVVGNPEPDRFQALLETFIESNQRVQQSILTAVSTISDASAQQSKVLGEYLKLFQQPGEPQGWRHPAEDELDEDANMKDLAKLGFPAGADEATQAKWVLDNIEKL
jgi:hypothetical protein